MQFDADSISGRAHVASVNVSGQRTVEWLGRPVTSAIWKQPVGGPVSVRGVNLAGDDQADRHAHGGPDKAVYAYAVEDYRFWRDHERIAIEPGLFGENLTLVGVDVSGARIGERWQIGSLVLEVSQPRIPCYKLGMRLGDQMFPRRFAAAGRPGAYLRIVREGLVAAGVSQFWINDMSSSAAPGVSSVATARATIEKNRGSDRWPARRADRRHV
ncbi:MAG: MOSC domain-containing protein [Chloroflexi bacterium]|nr:MOSC domain-containing protein [Chloroflexota bacterium]